MKFSKEVLVGLINKMAEIVIVCKTKNELPLLLNGFSYKNDPVLKIANGALVDLPSPSNLSTL
jgi:hypothetical protein